MKKVNVNKLFFIIVVSVFFILLQIYLFNVNLNKRFSEDIYLHLAETSSNKVFELNSEFKNQFEKIETLADYFSELASLQKNDVLPLMSKFVEAGGFSSIVLMYPDSTYLTNYGGKGLRVSESESFIKGINGEPNIEGPVKYFADYSKNVIVLSSPVKRGEEVVAVLMAAIDVSELDKLFNMTYYEGRGYMFLVNKSGSVITSKTNEQTVFRGENILEFFKEQNNSYYETISKDLETNESNVLYLKYRNGEARYAAYRPLGVNDWYVFSMVSQDVLDERVRGISLEVFWLTFVVVLSLSMLVGYVIFIQHRFNKQIVGANASLEKSEQLYRTIVSQSESTIFEHDYVTKKNTCSDNYKKMFGDMVDEADNFILSHKFVYYEDVDRLKSAYYALSTENPKASIELRILMSDLTYKWHKISMTVLYDGKNSPQKLIGNITNIHYDKHQAEQLKQKATKDLLTGLYNKSATQSLVNEKLLCTDGECIHALVNVDLDNFKSINDSFGHLFGDVVLAEIGEDLKKLFRSTDILGRFGGDEFVMFIKDVKSVHSITEKLLELLNVLDKTYKVDGISHRITGSIGVSVFPFDGQSYEELYKNADKALYAAKRAGKGKFFFYSNAFNAMAEVDNCSSSDIYLIKREQKNK